MLLSKHFLRLSLLRKMCTTKGQDFLEVKEGSAKILVPREESVFYNPIQQFNRDLSVMVIKAWSEIYSESQEKRKDDNIKKRKLDCTTETVEPQKSQTETNIKVFEEGDFIKILEALSATGLRALRYGHEVPKVKKVIANDMLSEAVKSIEKNISYNSLNGKVILNIGDAIKYMASTSEKFHVIDLDPYGTATPFIDGAFQAIKDDGLLMITCTDAGVLAGSGYPEKCFALYGGHNFGNSNMSSEANHEAGIRLILSMVAATGAKYKKAIEPLLSLSVDFYFRIFVKVNTRPSEVKQLANKTMLTYHCTGCGDKINQPLGRTSLSEKSNLKYQVPKLTIMGSQCAYCEGHYNLAGPLWAGKLHDKVFINKVLDINNSSDHNTYHTKERIKGMLTLASHELDVPYYFNLNQLSSLFKAPPIPIDTFLRGLGNLGFEASLTHAKRNCIKTAAPWDVVLKLNKGWLIESNKRLVESYKNKLKSDPSNEKVKSKINFYEENPSGNPNLTSGMSGYRIIEKLADFDCHFDFESNNKTSSNILQLRKIKLLRYQENPSNWGPKSKPK